ncbi:leucyl/phenylalanyl-tRNA--protein transferase [Methylonatrum kenyense]|uniref:leucyl/phenylalanyl-tRNA--protein transferase n=1 Tax=Methylonatrum kenyense TaxID=455253 RepID=UPI0020C0E92B|nr:leucyl/phenylalanyl-tRNA--protein transferase [Methylonatrum kenyense]MCK8515717.1 leucyl/phenylalanyl-tRNA--protein transferase [Methylonatrum kenyense]
MRPAFLDGRPEDWFPPAEQALDDPDGLLAIGGSLSRHRLLAAYRRGIFPWYSDGQPLLWWTPNPRAVLFPERLHVSRSLRKRLRNGGFRVTWDTDFAAVIDACAAPRAGEPGTWITSAMRAAYLDLHHTGVAHSVEVWRDQTLVGGLYGVLLGTVFFGESMFSHERDASKVALAWLVRTLLPRGLRLIDCQVPSDHLRRLGAEEIPRPDFQRLLEQAQAEELASIAVGGPPG